MKLFEEFTLEEVGILIDALHLYKQFVVKGGYSNAVLDVEKLLTKVEVGYSRCR